MIRVAAFVIAALSAWPAAAQERVSVPSLDGAPQAPLQLPGHWFAAAESGKRPAWLLLHGCGGPYGRNGELSQRMREYAALINAHRAHALVLDSLTPRGERELCAQRIGARQITQQQRRRDALGALRWLAARADVDAARIGVIGWSHGASTVLAVTNRAHGEVAAAAVQPRIAVAFYPGCSDERRRGYAPSAPLWLLLGAADDWTPAAPCAALAAQVTAPRPEVRIYPHAYHGFDGSGAVRLRTDVPNGVHPGQGVHVGGDPAARAASRALLIELLDATTASGG